LILTIEVVRLLQGKLISLDPAMANSDSNTMVNCSNILEDLGIIEYVVSDKTGTLTKNHLTMRQLSDGILIYDADSKNIP
jgi:phospholipid-transporting ATPase